ncbi:nuclear transport factor 2 family protein [Actinomadura sp. B10D3]|uniref:nuclear transport factor 2 family protein n=1 Tax=Actinomadura sp. B10D3 TaxID=3153557 RepID=UPI00325C4DF1
MADPSDLAERIARLEAIEEIKALKHRYLRACDAKDPAAFRDCFVASGASITRPIGDGCRVDQAGDFP